MNKRSGTKREKLKKMKSKWGKKQVFLVHVEPYRYSCIVVVNGQFSDAMKFMERTLPDITDIREEVAKHKEDYELKYESHTGSGRLYTELPGIYVMLVSHENDWKSTVGVVCHESLHLTSFILRNAGVEHNRDTEEAYTYCHQRVVEEILHKMY